MTVTRGNKVGTFQGKAFYLLPGKRCRLGSKGRTQTLESFTSALTPQEAAELQRLVQDKLVEAVEIVEAQVMAAERVAAIEPPATPSALQMQILPNNQIRINGEVLDVGVYFGRLSKSEARQTRKLLQMLGYRSHAAAKRA